MGPFQRTKFILKNDVCLETGFYASWSMFATNIVTETPSKKFNLVVKLLIGDYAPKVL